MNKHRRRHRRYLTFGYILVTCLLIVSAFTIGRGHVYSQSILPSDSGDGSSENRTQGSQTLLPMLTNETVMVVGGSMAHGWKDPHDNSYIRRAFASLSTTTNTVYSYDDRTIIGGTAAQLLKSQYQSWLAQDHPQVVVISWGLLNDIHDKTPLDAFNKAMHDEISDALRAHAVVLLVTPAVVKSTVTQADVVNQYIQNEFSVADSFHNPNVHFMDINADMTAYLAAHNQTWQQYYGDSWHPNEAGHILAGQLLFDDILETLGSSPISYRAGK